MYEDRYTEALTARTKMARLWEKMTRLHLEKVTNASDLGEIISLEILNWHQLVVLKWDKQLERGLGKPIPDSANPSTVYEGAPRTRVLGTETQINLGQPLELSVIALGTGDAPPVLKVRPLGRGAWPEALGVGSARGQALGVSAFLHGQAGGFAWDAAWPRRARHRRVSLPATTRPS